jgi:hypothetical protein
MQALDESMLRLPPDALPWLGRRVAAIGRAHDITERIDERARDRL